MKKLDYLSGSVLFLLAVLLYSQTRGLTIWGEYGPASGLFPLGLSILLGILSLVIILRAWFKEKTIRKIPKILGPDKKKYFFYLAAFFAFSLFFAKIGYTLTLVAFLMFILKFVEKQTWKVTFGIILISALVSHFLFAKFLSVQLPEGFLSPILKPM